MAEENKPKRIRKKFDINVYNEKRKIIQDYILTPEEIRKFAEITIQDTNDFFKLLYSITDYVSKDHKWNSGTLIEEHFMKVINNNTNKIQFRTGNTMHEQDFMPLNPALSLFKTEFKIRETSYTLKRTNKKDTINNIKAPDVRQYYIGIIYELYYDENGIPQYKIIDVILGVLNENDWTTPSNGCGTLVKSTILESFISVYGHDINAEYTKLEKITKERQERNREK